MTKLFRDDIVKDKKIPEDRERRSEEKIDGTERSDTQRRAVSYME